VQVQVSPDETERVGDKTVLASMVPVAAALNTPASEIVSVLVTVKVLANVEVSFVTVVVVRVQVAAARCDSVTKAVCVAANAVDPVP
jgi:hypothetical protein